MHPFLSPDFHVRWSTLVPEAVEPDIRGAKSIRDLLAQFGIIAEPGENIFKHTLATLLIGADGKILHREDGSNWLPNDFLKFF